MNMAVETFEVQEITDAGCESTEEQVALVEKLGLEGQESLLRGEGDEREVMPYRKLTEYERFVYKTLLPNYRKVEEYASGPIPVRVLQVIAHARDLGMEHLYVWCPEDANDPDPLLVGGVESAGYSGAGAYILARWGPMLEPFEVLAQKAAKLARALLIGRLRKATTEIEADIKMVEQTDEPEVIAKWGNSGSYHGLR
jgi:hypothetical protein